MARKSLKNQKNYIMVDCVKSLMIFVRFFLFGSFFLCVLFACKSEHGVSTLCCNNKHIITLVNERPLQEQVLRENTQYIVNHNFSLREDYTCDLTNTIKTKEGVFYGNKTPIHLYECQTIWIPRSCWLIESNSGSILSEGGYIPDKEIFVYIIGKETTMIEYSVAGVLIIPEDCILRFNSGSIIDGVIIGNETILEYRQPFLDCTHLLGTWLVNGIVKDTDIYIDHNYTWARIHSCLSILSSSREYVFSKHIYNDMRTIKLESDINIDFGGSTFYMSLDKQGLPVSFITTACSLNRSQIANKYTNIAICNVSIIGNPLYNYNNTAIPGFSGKYRRAIQLFKASHVNLKNITLSHYVVGTTNSSEGLPPSGINRYMNSAIVVWGYDHCLIDSVKIHDCHADNLIRLVPNINEENLAIVKNCYAFKNYTGLLALYDGRIDCYNNIVEDNNSSAFNLFCYESKIHNNMFRNSHRSCAIDISEDGMYQSDNVLISHNVVEASCGGLVDVCGNNILVRNNIINGNKEGVSAIMISVPRTNKFELGETTNNKFAGTSLKDIFIIDNESSGYPMFIRSVQSTNVIALKSDIKYETVTIERNIFEGLDKKESYGGILYLPPIRRIILRDNMFSGSNYAIGTSGWGTVLTIQSSLSNDYYFSEMWIELKNNIIKNTIINPNKDVLIRINASNNNKPQGHFHINLDAQGNVCKNKYNNIIGVNGNVADYDVMITDEDNVNLSIKTSANIKSQNRD